MSEAKCGLCGEPMPPGEEMFKYHGYSGDCPVKQTREVKKPPSTVSIDEQIADMERRYESLPHDNNKAILASLRRLKAIEEAQMPGETEMLTTLLKQPLLLPVRQHIDALITHADHWRERAERLQAQIDDERRSKREQTIDEARKGNG